jgi:subtilisin family serine protease
MFSGGIVVQPVLGQVQVTKLTAGEVVDGFGVAVAIDGDWAVVGAPETDSDGDPPKFFDIGAAYVFKRVGSSWGQRARLNPTNATDNIAFGASVAIDGDTIAVGEPHNDLDGNGRGFVYIFRLSGGVWTQEAKFSSSNYPEEEAFGFPVALDGDVLVAGATGVFGGFHRAYVFRRTGTVWTEEAALVPDDSPEGEGFGWSADVSGDRVVVGAPYDDDACTSDPSCDSGAAYVFRFVAGSWVQETKLVASDAAPGTRFGRFVGISGADLFVGAGGGVYVFAHDGNTWVEEEKIIPSSPASLDSLATDGVLLLAGEPGDDGNGFNAGIAYLFSRDDSVWVEDLLTPKDAAAQQQFGYAVSVSGNYAIIGTGGFDGAYVFATNIDVPAVSTWGLLVLTLLTLGAGTLLLRRRSRMKAICRMNELIAVLLLVITVMSGDLRGGETDPRLESPHHPNQLLVRFCEDAAESDRAAAHIWANGSEIKRYRHFRGLALVDVPEGQLADALSSYEAEPCVEFAEPDYFVYPASEPNDPLFYQQWALKDTVSPIADIRAVDAWAFWTGDPDFRIAVLDTGVNYNHEDLGANMWTNPFEEPGDANEDGCPGECDVDDDNDGQTDECPEFIPLGWSCADDDDENGYVDDFHGYNFVGDGNNPPSIDPMDTGHGTHVAGIAAAQGNNEVGVAGVCWDASIVALRVLGAPGSHTLDGIEYVIDNNIKLSNNSWISGFSGECPAALYTAIQDARDEIGHLFITAAGNSNNDVDVTKRGPCGCALDNIICVAATEADDSRWYQSSYGHRTVDIGAPGDAIRSTYGPNSYANDSGTSMASPHVAGVAALIMSRRPDWTYDIVRDRILLTARPVADLECLTVTGGVVDAGAAVWDCNDNGIADECDIDCEEEGCDPEECGGSTDCNANTLPDECEPDEDCNNNQVQDVCDIYSATSDDCNGDRIPDECQPDEDCNENEVTDICDIGIFTSHDCNCNLVPDECEEDCNNNNVQDDCDLRHVTSLDCNENLVPDECDISNGTSYDCDLTGVQGKPDECEGGKACCDPWTGECTTTFESCCDALGGHFYSHKTCTDIPLLSCPTYNFTEP